MRFRIVGTLLGLLLCCAIVCSAQSPVTQTVSIAQGSSVKLTANNSTGAVRYQWLRNGADISGATAMSYIVATAGTYSVVSYNSNDCVSDVSGKVIVTLDATAFEADVSIVKKSDLTATTINQIFEYHLTVKNSGPNEANGIKIQDILPKELTFEELIKPQKGTAVFQAATGTIVWDIPKLALGESDELILRVKATQMGEIRNTATITADETDPKTANNSSMDIKFIVGIKVPNVFTPNNDGKNDTFKIVGLENYPNNEIVIINRWGSHVYEKTGYTNDWAGNGLSDGTYFYILRVKSPTSSWQEFKGYITIMR